MRTSRTIEYTVAVASFVAAMVFAFVSLAIADAHEVAAGNCSVVAQFLILTASIFGEVRGLYIMPSVMAFTLRISLST